MADVQPQIPERMKQPLEEGFVLFPEPAGKQHEDVDVRIGVKLASAESSGREQRDPVAAGRQRGSSLAVGILDHALDEPGHGPKRGLHLQVTAKVLLEPIDLPVQFFALHGWQHSFPGKAAKSNH